MSMQQALPGMKGFDCNLVITDAIANAFKRAGYMFAVRYVPRVTAHPGDLTAAERLTLLRAGLALMPVQHVKSAESWVPTADLGTQYGHVAAAAAQACAIVPGTTLWCDLEGVEPGTDPAIVRAYANNWCEVVKAVGYQPGLYVGWHAILTPQQLYNLAFTRYWSAYNLNGDQYPAVRGVCMQQHAAKPTDLPANVPWAKEDIDVDTIRADALGGLPCVDAPDAWQPD